MYKYVFQNEFVIIISNLLKYDIGTVFKGKIFIVANGIPDERYDNIYNKGDKTFSILFFSNLILSKGICDFLEVIPILVKKKLYFHAKIVGAEGDFLESDLNKIIRKKSLKEYVEYVGPKYGEEKYKIFENTDVLIFPTLDDILGIVNLEAMQFGIPIIATKEGAIPEVIDDGVTGFLVDKNSPDQIAKKVEILIKNPKLCESMGKAGRKKYEKKYTYDIFEKNMKKVFDEVIRSTTDIF